MKDADKRLYVGIGMLILHSILFALPLFEHYGPSTGSLVFPFISLNHASIAIIATCFSQWYKMDPDNPCIGFKKRILPGATICIVIFYCLDWIQSSEHHDVITALALLAIATFAFMSTVFYSLEQFDFKIPILSEMGKNMLLIFILTLFVGLFVGIIPKDFLVANPLHALLLIGILPIAILGGIAVLLDRKNIKIKI